MQQPYMGQQGNPQQQRGGRGGRYQGNRGPRNQAPGGPPQQPQLPQGFENLKTMEKSSPSGLYTHQRCTLSHHLTYLRRRKNLRVLDLFASKHPKELELHSRS
jgi:hypothetical protein